MEEGGSLSIDSGCTEADTEGRGSLRLWLLLVKKAHEGQSDKEIQRGKRD